MGDTDVDVVLRTIKDPTAVYLQQHLQRGGVEVMDPPRRIANQSGIYETTTQEGQVGRGNSIHC